MAFFYLLQSPTRLKNSTRKTLGVGLYILSFFILLLPYVLPVEFDTSFFGLNTLSLLAMLVFYLGATFLPTGFSLLVSLAINIAWFFTAYVHGSFDGTLVDPARVLAGYYALCIGFLTVFLTAMVTYLNGQSLDKKSRAKR